VPPAEVSPALPVAPQRQFRHLQEELRLALWDYCEQQNYNPWYRLIALGCDARLDPQLQFDCHKEVAQYLLAKLASIKIEGAVEHHHTSEPLQVLFAQWEQEEEQERASLPPWTPPGLEALEMWRDGSGTWDLDDEEDEDVQED
jgi:hypothetical protein